MIRRATIGVGVGLAACALAWLIGLSETVRRTESSSYDTRLQLVAAKPGGPSDIAVIDIGESSLREVAKLFGRWPWPRVVHSAVVDFLKRAGAKVIAYDVLFTEPDNRGSFTIGTTSVSGAESDSLFVESVQKAGNVILLADATYEGAADPAKPPVAPADFPGPPWRPGSGFETRTDVLLPIDDLRKAAMGVGHNFFVRDADGPMRRTRPFIDLGDGRVMPFLGVAAALTALKIPPDAVRLDPATNVLAIGDRLFPLLAEPVPGAGAPSRQQLIRYRAAPRSSQGDVYPTYPFFNVVLSEDQASSGKTPVIDPSVFKDKVVFIGTTASGLADIYSTPFGGQGAGGVFIHAAVADDILSARPMRRASPGTDVAVMVGAGLVTGVIAVLLPVPWATGAVLALMAVMAVVLTRLVGQGVWVAAVSPLTAMMLALFGGVAWQYFVEGREKRKVKGLFGRYVSKDVFAHLMANPALAKLGGQRREMTVLFSDIRGFTTASEKSTPEAVVAQLNEYFTAMVAILFKHEGTLDKFVGDMVMGLFGAPVDDSRHADHAVLTAVEMSEELDRLNARWAAAGRAPLDIGIGINSGEMIAGNIGSDTVMSYTVIGDAVNLGSRIESLNKNYGTRILISQATKDLLTIDVPLRRVDDVTVKGKSVAVTIYEVQTIRH